MNYFTTRKQFLIASFELDSKEQEKLDRFLHILDESGVSELIRKETVNTSKGGRPPYRDYDLFATILYGFAFKNRSLRDLESACKYDLRYISLMQQQRPSHTVFCNFINEIIVPNSEEIFYRITKTIIKEFNIDISEIFIDGSKFEADANKYKFVWKPTKYHEKLCDKIRTLLKSMNMSRNIPEEGIFESKLIARKITELSSKIKNSDETINQIALTKNYEELYQYLCKALEYEEKERICGPNRNSYYKTDHDATAMCLKSDYYAGLGSNMHAAYNTQLAVSKGIIVSFHVSQSRTDYEDFIPIIESLYKYYGKYPKLVCADSGYGSLKNYEYLDQKRIENYVKYRSWQGNVSGQNPDKYHLNEDNTITCLNGSKGVIVDIPNRHPTKTNSIFYKVTACANCGFASYCKRHLKTKEEDYRIFEVDQKLIYYKQEAEKNLLSVKGIEMRVNRSSQVEGAYGVIKQDMEYTRLKRTTMEKVKTEIMLICLGYNIKKLFRYFEGKAKFNYWIVPDNIMPESFKKPSAKRLSKKAQKKATKGLNEQSKSQYKHRNNDPPA